jgi:predicted CopG family antitoxin
METTTIEVREDQADALHDLKDRGDSYKDVIERLLALAEDAQDGRLASLRAPETALEERREAVKALEIPGQGDAEAQRREAVRAVVEHLERQERAPKSELVEIGAELAGDTYADKQSLWKNLAQPALADLELVESEGPSGYWRWRAPSINDQD